MDHKVFTYIAYLVISIALTIWVARTLFRNGQPFLDDAFGGDERLAKSVNHLLVVGFYLINLGYITLRLKIDSRIPDLQSAIEALAVQIGLVLLVLGVMHFFNLYVFNKIRKRRHHSVTPPPVVPSTRLRDLSNDRCESGDCAPLHGSSPNPA